jgi:hypothetical protein
MLNERGMPFTLSRVNKDTSFGRGPKPAAKYGPAHLYDPEEFLRYGLERVTKLTEDAAA